MMPKITGSIAALTYDLARARQDLHRELQDIFLTGTKAWVRTVVGIVPTWSGASQEALRSIADLVGEPVFSSPQSHTDSSGRFRPAPDRRSEGAASSVASLENTGPIYSFRWQTNLFHLIYNEFNNANLVGFRLRNPGPYHAQARAHAEFNAIVKSRLANLHFDWRNHISVNQRVIGK